MRIPKINKMRLDKVEDTEEIVVDIKPNEYYDDLGLFDDEREFHRFIVRLKYYVRNSYEYKRMMKFLKKCRGMYCCGTHNNITIWDGFPINIHHTPFVMEDIIYIIIKKRKDLGESLKMSAIGKEVMMIHYMGLVGLYPLCETCHEYAHGDTNDLFIPMTAIYGDPEAFYEIYKDFFTDALRNKYENIQELNKGYQIIEREIPESLIKKYIYVYAKGQEMMSIKALYSFIQEVNQS